MYFRRQRRTDPTLAIRYAQSWKPDMGTVMYHGLKESFETTSLALMGSLLKRFEEKRTGKPVTEAEWRSSKFYRPGLKYEDDMTEEFAKSLAMRYDNRNASQLVYERTGKFGAAAYFGSALVGALPDPINIIPFMRLIPGGSVMRNIMARNALGRVQVGAIEGGLGAAALQPVLRAEKLTHQERYDLKFAAIDVLVGIGAGGVLSGVMEGGKLALHKYRTNSSTGRRTPIEDSRIYRNLSRLPLETQVENARHAVIRLADGREVDVASMDNVPDQQTYIRPPDHTVEGLGVISIPGHGEIKTRFELAESDSLVASHIDNVDQLTPNDKYPAGLQPRSRETMESVTQIQQISGSNFRPRSIVEADVLGKSGAPVVGLDNLVESGNVRILALRRIYKEGGKKLDSYKAEMKAWARTYGLDPAKVDSMKEPILIRRRMSDLSPETRIIFTQHANVSDFAAMRSSELAMNDARLIKNEDLRMLRSSDLTSSENAPFLRTIFNRLPAEERQALTVNDKITVDGKTRIKNALLAKAYGSKDLIDDLTDFGGEEYLRIAGSLREASNIWASMRSRMESGDLYNYDPNAFLVDAVHHIQSARQTGVALKDIVEKFSQPYLDGLEDVKMDGNIILFIDFLANTKSRKQIVAGLHAYAGAVEALGSPKQAEILEVDIKSMQNILDETIGEHRTIAKVEERIQADKEAGLVDDEFYDPELSWGYREKIRSEVEKNQVNANDEVIDYTVRDADEVIDEQDFSYREPTEEELRSIDAEMERVDFSQEEMDAIRIIEEEHAYHENLGDAMDDNSKMINCILGKL